MTEPSDSPSGYWYGPKPRTVGAVDVLNGLRRYRKAETAMRRRTRASMRMGETDLLALQYLLRTTTGGTAVGPRDLSRYLGISSASTTVLIDRLVRSGHVMRHPHPTDRRALTLSTTATTDAEVRATLGKMHSRMLAAAEQLSPTEMQAVLRFLESMKDAVDVVDAHDEQEPRARRGPSVARAGSARP
jgi:DNA-binding MarR family transcriptional regulator